MKDTIFLLYPFRILPDSFQVNINNWILSVWYLNSVKDVTNHKAIKDGGRIQIKVFWVQALCYFLNIRENKYDFQLKTLTEWKVFEAMFFIGF